MADVITFGPAGNTVNLLDATKYKIGVPSGQSFREDPIIEEEYTRQRDGVMLLKSYTVYGYEISFDLFIRGTGASYQAAIANYGSVQDRLDLAIDFQKGLGGSVVQFIHQRHDQTTAETYNVIGGVLKKRDQSMLTSRGINASLKLTCVVV